MAVANGEKQSSFYDRLPEQHVDPLWKSLKAVVTPEPSPKAEVALWKYNDLRPLLLEAGRVVTAEEADRRVLMLTNPALRPPFTTDTVYAGLQLILPGEIAPAHRHRAFALRFIIEGSRGFTAVEGQKLYMQEGDVVLTPRWQWHDHGHEGDGPMIWLDGLDVPLYQSLPVHFAEPYKDKRYPSKEVDETPLCFKWSDMKARLDRDSGKWSSQTYLDASGNYISGTVGAHAERLNSNSQSSARKDTCSYVYHAHVGHGRSKIVTAAGEERTVKWEKNDTFAVPAWSSITHYNDGDEDAYLFVLSDRPLLEALKLYHAAEM